MKTHLRVFSEGSRACVTPGDNLVHGQQQGMCVQVLRQVEVDAPSGQPFTHDPPSSLGPAGNRNGEGTEAVYSEGIELQPVVGCLEGGRSTILVTLGVAHQNWHPLQLHRYVPTGLQPPIPMKVVMEVEVLS